VEPVSVRRPRGHRQTDPADGLAGATPQLGDGAEGGAVAQALLREGCVEGLDLDGLRAAGAQGVEVLGIASGNGLVGRRELQAPLRVQRPRGVRRGVGSAAEELHRGAVCAFSRRHHLKRARARFGHAQGPLERQLLEHMGARAVGFRRRRQGQVAAGRGGEDGRLAHAVIR
jgi:hypothetical protein